MLGYRYLGFAASSKGFSYIMPPFVNTYKTKHLDLWDLKARPPPISLRTPLILTSANHSEPRSAIPQSQDTIYCALFSLDTQG